MAEASRLNVVVSPPVRLLAIKKMLVPIGAEDNPFSTPLTPPMAAPAFLAIACLVTAEEPQFGQLII